MKKQSRLVMEIAEKYSLNPEIFINNDDLELDIELINSSSVIYTTGKFVNFFMNEEDKISFESWSKKGTINDIEFKLRAELNSKLKYTNSRAYVFPGNLGLLEQNLILVAGKELMGMNHNVDGKTSKMTSFYPGMKKNNNYKAGNLEGITMSYLEEANPIVVDPLTTRVYTYKDVAHLKPIKQVYKETDVRIMPDLIFHGGFEVPVHYNYRSDRMLVLGLEDIKEKTMHMNELPYIKFIEQGNYHKHRMSDIFNNALVFGNSPLGEFYTEKEMEIITKYKEICQGFKKNVGVDVFE